MAPGGTVTCSFTNLKQAPALTLTKSASPSTYDTVGQSISYTYVIKNTGNVTLNGPFSVTDDKATVSLHPADGQLRSRRNEEMTCTATYTVTQADLDASKITNKATATNGTVTSNEATATVYAVGHPNLSLVKTASPANYDHVGQTISYSYVVKNIGNVALMRPVRGHRRQITASKVVTCPQTPDQLPVGASITCSGHLRHHPGRPGRRLGDQPCHRDRDLWRQRRHFQPARRPPSTRPDPRPGDRQDRCRKRSTPRWAMSSTTATR